MKKLAILAVVLSLTACSHQKVAVNKLSDAQLNCHEIVSETKKLDDLLKDIESKTGFSGRNVGMGLLFWPGIFVNQMSASDSVKLANKRLEVLNSLYKDKQCNINVSQKN